MSNLENATFPCFKKADGPAKASAKLKGFTVRLNRIKKSKTGESRKALIRCVHSACYKKKGSSIQNALP